MKRIIYFIASVVLLMTACDKTDPVNTQEQYDKYIFFSQSVNTKASLIEGVANLNGQSFGVVGFKYPNTANSNWSSYLASNPSATPNVFYDGTSLVNVESVECDEDGDGSYSPIQGWSNTKKYTFFAFYPINNDYVSLANINGTDYAGGVPAIKHTLDLTDAASLKGSMVDVMTAPACMNLDGSAPANNGEVTFAFKHCLSALGVNFENASTGTITLTEVTLKISGIQYKGVVIPLDGSTASPIAVEETDQTNFTVPMVITDESEIGVTEETKNKELSDKLIFVPQSANLGVQVLLKYKREAGGDNVYETSTATLTTALTKGKKHLIKIKFTESTVNVEASFSAEEGWTTLPPVTDTFN